MLHENEGNVEKIYMGTLMGRVSHSHQNSNITGPHGDPFPHGKGTISFKNTAMSPWGSLRTWERLRIRPWVPAGHHKMTKTGNSSFVITGGEDDSSNLFDSDFFDGAYEGTIDNNGTLTFKILHIIQIYNKVGLTWWLERSFRHTWACGTQSRWSSSVFCTSVQRVV